MFTDLREFLKGLHDLGELRLVEGADCEQDIGQITETAAVTPGTPALLFDSIRGYPKGMRVGSHVFGARSRCALAMGADPRSSARELVEFWRRRLAEPFKPVSPVKVSEAPVLQHVLTGDQVDLFKFPAPRWHALDGGRYIGTGCTVIMRDPDDGWVNLGTYRAQVHDRSTATIYIAPGKHGDLIRRKYWAKGRACPVVVTCGQSPVLTMVASSSNMPRGMSEYDEAGWLQGAPVEVVPGPGTGLPVPASAEIALEGEMVPPEVETRSEGPFGEWTGYYASGARNEPVFRVKTIMHRHDPIILGLPPTMSAEATSPGLTYRRAAQRWSGLEKKVSGVKGVWEVPQAMGNPMVVVSLEQQYAGHAKRAAITCLVEEAIMARWVIVVDEDIDPYNMDEVIWAVATRCDPAESVDSLRGWWGNHLDAMLEPEKRRRGDLTHAVGIILACKPYHWKSEFPPAIKPAPEQVDAVRARWPEVFGL